jgi:CDP-4-dehydro-6-deoxyglucose reductase, E1
MIPLMKGTFLCEYATKKALAEFILQTSKLSMDVQCLEFEKAFSRFQGRGESVLFNSGGSANLALLQALKNLGWLKDGDKIGFSALTWSTNVMPIIQLGLVPVAIDCEPSTLNSMSHTLQERMERVGLKAFFMTNALGLAGDLDAIERLCRASGVLLLEDNCEALGTELPTKKTGNFGIASTFSFFVAHHMSTIEGGMACTDSEELAEMLRMVRANGWDRNLSSAGQVKWRKKCGVRDEFTAKYTFYDLGFNFRPTEITGFLGLYQLQFLAENIAIRERNYRTLKDVALKNPDLVPLDTGHLSVVSSFAFPVLCKSRELRKRYLSQFSGAGVEARPMIAGNIQKQPFYRKYVTASELLPGAEQVDTCGFYFGNYPDLTEMDLEVLKSALRRY